MRSAGISTPVNLGPASAGPFVLGTAARRIGPGAEPHALVEAEAATVEPYAANERKVFLLPKNPVAIQTRALCRRRSARATSRAFAADVPGRRWDPGVQRPSAREL